MKSEFSECPDLSCSRSDSTLEPVTSSFPAASESLRANSQSSAVVQPVRPHSRSFSPVRVQSVKVHVTGKTRCHKRRSVLHLQCVGFLETCSITYTEISSFCCTFKFERIVLPSKRPDWQHLLFFFRVCKEELDKVLNEL